MKYLIAILLITSFLSCKRPEIDTLTDDEKLISRDWHNYVENMDFYKRFIFKDDGTGYAYYVDESTPCDTLEGPTTWSISDNTLSMVGANAIGGTSTFVFDIKKLDNSDLTLKSVNSTYYFYPYVEQTLYGGPLGNCNQ